MKLIFTSHAAFPTQAQLLQHPLFLASTFLLLGSYTSSYGWRGRRLNYENGRLAALLVPVREDVVVHRFFGFGGLAEATKVGEDAAHAVSFVHHEVRRWMA